MQRRENLIPRFATCLMTCVFAVLLSPRDGMADLYEWTDAEGTTHYTNEPRPGSNPVGLAPIALEPEESPERTATDDARTERLDRLKAERWVDEQDEFPSRNAEPALVETNPSHSESPASPAKDETALTEKACLEEQGQSCLEVEAWLQLNGFDCDRGAPGRQCREQARVEIEKTARAKARARLEREDAARLKAAR